MKYLLYLAGEPGILLAPDILLVGRLRGTCLLTSAHLCREHAEEQQHRAGLEATHHAGSLSMI